MYFSSFIVVTLGLFAMVSAEDAYMATESEMVDNEVMVTTETIVMDFEPSTEDEMKESESAPATETITILFEEIQPNASASEVVETKADQELVNPNQDMEEALKAENLNESLTGFSCYGRSFGQYADVSQECRVFHLCYPYFNETSDELLYQRITFLCDNDSIFDQKRFVCTENATIDHKCHDSEALYQTSNQEYLIRVFSQSVSANSEEVDRSDKTSNSRGWFNWFSRN